MNDCSFAKRALEACGARAALPVLEDGEDVLDYPLSTSLCAQNHELTETKFDHSGDAVRYAGPALDLHVQFHRAERQYRTSMHKGFP